MFEYFEVQEGTPRDIGRFEQVWTLVIAVSAMIAVGMYDISVALLGDVRAILVIAVMFAIGTALMGFISRRRSGIARWLLIPFALFVFFYDLSHFAAEVERGWIAWFGVARVGLMVTAIYFLFTPRSRAWLAGTPMPPGGEDEDWG